MGDVVNLRRVRKSRARAEKAAEADRNRLAFGRSKAEIRAVEAEAGRQARDLDAHLIAPPAHGLE